MKLAFLESRSTRFIIYYEYMKTKFLKSNGFDNLVSKPPCMRNGAGDLMLWFFNFVLVVLFLNPSFFASALLAWFRLF